MQVLRLVAAVLASRARIAYVWPAGFRSQRWRRACDCLCAEVYGPKPIHPPVDNSALHGPCDTKVTHFHGASRQGCPRLERLN